MEEMFIPIGVYEEHVIWHYKDASPRENDAISCSSSSNELPIRFVRRDHDSFLRYADQDMFALVLLFHQSRTQQADQHMAAMTREVIEAVLHLGGRYYLPYHLHPTPEQCARCYPQAQRFFELKQKCCKQIPEHSAPINLF